MADPGEGEKAVGQDSARDPGSEDGGRLRGAAGGGGAVGRPQSREGDGAEGAEVLRGRPRGSIAPPPLLPPRRPERRAVRRQVGEQSGRVLGREGAGGLGPKERKEAAAGRGGGKPRPVWRLRLRLRSRRRGGVRGIWRSLRRLGNR